MDVADLPLHKRTFEILKAAGKEFGEDKAGRMGAALSYYTIFSLVPLLFLVVAVAGFVSAANGSSDDPSYTDNLISSVQDVAGDEVAGSLAEIVDVVEEQAGGALSIGIVLSIFSASTIFAQVQGVLSVVFHVPEDQRRTGPIGFLVQRGIGALSALTLAVLAFTPVAAVAAVGLIPDDWGWVRTAARFAVPVVSLLLLMGVVGLTFQVMTVVEIPWKAAVRGGMATAAVGLIAAFLVGIYLGNAGGTGALGALGGAAILLFFFNLMWAVYLFGAEVTKVYSDYLQFGDIVRPSVRASRQQLERSPHPVSRAQPDGADAESVAKAGVVAFILGGVFGWLGGRRR